MLSLTQIDPMALAWMGAIFLFFGEVAALMSLPSLVRVVIWSTVAEIGYILIGIGLGGDRHRRTVDRAEFPVASELSGLGDPDHRVRRDGDLGDLGMEPPSDLLLNDPVVHRAHDQRKHVPSTRDGRMVYAFLPDGRGGGRHGS